ncbi:hypothetical protein JKP88DRAFT_232841 [Tribonema minus]|uniref:Uncharacterized protein n=1 Tax=Tribonema minus TaxID=303371 RepID=A0A835ZBA8_9STRA|nr:hypothetical protein JKP88DRAFT_232841 [Tribonema minus]
MEEEAEDDLYGDLKVSNDSVLVAELHQRLAEEEKRNLTLKRKVDQLETREKELVELVSILETNISCLYTTAKHEIARQHSTILQLQTKVGSGRSRGYSTAMGANST